MRDASDSRGVLVIKLVISYPISVILEVRAAKRESRAGYNIHTVRDRIALLGPFRDSKWSRSGITHYLMSGVGAVGPNSDMYNQLWP